MGSARLRAPSKTIVRHCQSGGTPPAPVGIPAGHCPSNEPATPHGELRGENDIAHGPHIRQRIVCTIDLATDDIGMNNRQQLAAFLVQANGAQATEQSAAVPPMYTREQIAEHVHACVTCARHSPSNLPPGGSDQGARAAAVPGVLDLGWCALGVCG